jgi:hypothetical protein
MSDAQHDSAEAGFDGHGGLHADGHDAGHGDDHGHGGHDEPVLGPPDWTAWIFGIAGVVIAAIMWACFAIATS